MTSRQQIHLMPVVMTAAALLLALKTIGFATHTSYLFASPAAAASPAAEAAPETNPTAVGQSEKPKPPKAETAGGKLDPTLRPTEVKLDPAADESPSERALLEALKQRREALEGRADDLDAREKLLKAAERRVEERLVELKKLEQQIAASDALRDDEDKARLKALVSMYEGMKVKEAARIFERLDRSVLLDVASRMKPPKMSEILGQMAPDAAQRLTVALARRDAASERPEPRPSAELPKIEGRPLSRP